METRFRIGDSTVQPRLCLVSSGGQRVHLEPKAMDLLVYLVRRAGQVVPREDILRDVWRGVVVSDDALTRAVSGIRRALNDDSHHPRLLETIPKRGYRIVARVSFQEMAPPTPHHRMPFVGHKDELSVLCRSLESATRGQGLVVSVTGETGIGKTALVEEFLAGEAAVGCRIGRGLCSETRMGTGAYLPLLEVLESLAARDLAVPEMLGRLAPSWYAQLYPNAAESRALSAQARGAVQEWMKRELTLFFRELTTEEKGIVFLDDIHWASRATVDVLSYLLDRCPSMRLLVVVTYRPERLLGAKHPFLDVEREKCGHGSSVSLPVASLTVSDIGAYLAAVFPANRFPDDLARAIHERTEGNPLFVSGLVEFLRDREIIAVDSSAGQWSLLRPISEIDDLVPQSVLSLIDRKLDALTEEDRRLLRCASVQGHRFDSGVVARALGAEPEVVEERLRRLDRIHGFVREMGAPAARAAVPNVSYQFRHVLYRDKIYGSLTPSRRSELSGTVARALSETLGDTGGAFALQLAALYQASGDSALAAEHCLLAATHTLEVMIDAEAVEWARKGLSHLVALPDDELRRSLEPRLQLVLAIALTKTLGYAAQETSEAFSRLSGLCSDGANAQEFAAALVGLSLTSAVRLNFKAAIEFAERGLTMCRPAMFPGVRALLHSTAAGVYFHSGELGKAMDHARRALLEFDPNDHTTSVALSGLDADLSAQVQLSRLLWLAGLPDQARTQAEAAVADARRCGQCYTQAFVLFMAGSVFDCLGEYSASMQWASEAVATADKHRYPMFLGWSRGLLGRALFRQDRLQESLDAYNSALDVLRFIGSRLLFTEFLAHKAETLAGLGKTQPARAALDEAMRLMEEGGERFYEPELHRTRASLLLREPSDANISEAEGCVRRGLDAARRQGSRSFELRAATALAELLLAHGREREAFEELSGPLGRFTEGFGTVDLRRAATVLKAARNSSAREVVSPFRSRSG